MAIFVACCEEGSIVFGDDDDGEEAYAGGVEIAASLRCFCRRSAAMDSSVGAGGSGTVREGGYDGDTVDRLSFHFRANNERITHLKEHQRRVHWYCNNKGLRGRSPIV